MLISYATRDGKRFTEAFNALQAVQVDAAAELASIFVETLAGVRRAVLPRSHAPMPWIDVTIQLEADGWWATFVELPTEGPLGPLVPRSTSRAEQIEAIGRVFAPVTISGLGAEVHGDRSRFLNAVLFRAGGRKVVLSGPNTDHTRRALTVAALWVAQHPDLRTAEDLMINSLDEAGVSIERFG